MRRTFRLLPLLLLPLAAPPAVPQTAAPDAPSPDAAAATAEEEELAVLPYRVEIRPTGDDRLDAALSAVSRLVELQERAPTGALGILSRAEGDRERLPQALQSEGYWGGSARIEIGGVPLGSPELLERLERAGARPGGEAPGEPLAVTILVEPGPQYRIASVTVTPDGPAGAEAVAAALARPLGVAPGDPARAGPILDAEQALKDRMLAAGYPLAAVADRETVVDHDRRSMEVAWRLAPGPLARFAPPEVEGMAQVEGEFLSRQASRLTDDLYSPERLERQRKELMALGAFDSVRARAAERLDETGRLPVTFAFAERARHAVGATAAYETNYGPTVRLYWEHRNLFGRAERLRIEGEVARIGTGGSADQMTYRGGITFRAPGRFGRDNALVINLGAVRERLDPYDRDAITGALLLERRVSERLTVQAGPVFDFGSIGPPGGRLEPYQIAGVTFTGRYDGTDSLLDPGRGWRLNGALTPSWSFRDSEPFAPLRVTASTYWDLLGDKRGILAVRGTLGSLLGGDRANVPRHQRFYAGGGGSVRGYDYQSIGPRDERNQPSGGASLLEASLEWRQRVWGDIGAVAFVDAGTVGTSTLPGFDELRVGAGLGVRYFTPIGPIRADVAVPLVKQTGSSGYGLYVGIGQAF